MLPPVAFPHSQRHRQDQRCTDFRQFGASKLIDYELSPLERPALLNVSKREVGGQRLTIQDSFPVSSNEKVEPGFIIYQPRMLFIDYDPGADCLIEQLLCANRFNLDRMLPRWQRPETPEAEKKLTSQVQSA
jgi:hypothetical protein